MMEFTSWFVCVYYNFTLIVLFSQLQNHGKIVTLIKELLNRMPTPLSRCICIHIYINATGSKFFIGSLIYKHQITT